MENVVFNKCQTPLEDLHLDQYPNEVVEQFWDYLNNVPFIKWMVSKDRPYIHELPRDEYGRAIIDVTHPPILEYSDYFRQTAKVWEDTGSYTKLRPNRNPNSDFGKWLIEERRRSWDGFTDPSTGMWVTGDYYFMLNYCPMHQTVKRKDGLDVRVVKHPKFWDGQFFMSHYFLQARQHGHQAAELASRGKGKTTLGAAMLSKRFILGESSDNQSGVQCLVTAADKTKLIGTNQILSVFKDNIDFCAKNTQFASQRLKSSTAELTWKMGYKKKGSDVEYGSRNEVSGIISGVNQDKLNGSRGVLYLIEEAGIFKDLLNMYNLIRPSVEQGSSVFGEILSYGCVCAGTKVWTNNGRNINIEDLIKEDGIIGYDENGYVKNTIGTLLEPRTKPCVKISWNKGKDYIECSTDHPILKYKLHYPRIGKSNERYRVPEMSFVRADELKVGDTIVEGRYIGSFGTDTLGDARLIGMLIGDGSYGFDNTPKYSSEDAELLNYVKERYDWGVSAEHITKNGKHYQDIRVKGICPVLRKAGIYGQTKTDKRLPVNYMTLTEEDTKLLLAGLYDTDGCISSRGIYSQIELTQANEEILKQVAILLRKFGITSHIAENKPSIKPGRKDKNPWYILSIGGRTNIELFKQYIPIMQHAKVKKLNDLCDYFSTMPVKKNRYYDTKKFIIRKISSIESIGEQTIYNLSAEQSHTYLANNIITHNTAGDDQSDFTAFAEMIYSPEGYNMEPLDNVFDKEGQGRKKITEFYPAYLNYDNTCIDEDGNSDVTKALLMLLMDRYKVKYGSTDVNTITKRISQYPITPQEAIIRSKNNIFPVTELNNRLNELDNNPSAYDEVYVGDLVYNESTGGVDFVNNTDLPIRDYPLKKDTDPKGALQIYSMPKKNSNGEIPQGRYILSLDPYYNDQADSVSLGSIHVLDLWTDTLAASYIGRPPMSDDLYELLRKMCIFYNGKCMYENNAKGCFAYFSKCHCLYLLAETPEYLRDKQLIKVQGIGNTAFGVRATVPIINYGFGLIKDWLMKPTTRTIKNENGEEAEITLPNLYNIKDRELLKELILWNPNGNYDSIMSLLQLMLYREEKMIIFNGDVKKSDSNSSGLENDDYFNRNYPGKKSYRTSTR